jgi:hypothetical protein
MITLSVSNDAPGNIPQAVSQANSLLGRIELFDKIAERSTPFDYCQPSDLSPLVVAEALKAFNKNFEVIPAKLGSSTTGAYTCNISEREKLYVSNRPYHTDNSVATIVGTLIHECVHALDCFSPEFQLGHGDNSSVGKENFAPYWIGNLAANIVSGTNNIKFDLFVETNLI